nr:PH domain-containing protein [Alteraurantiacibacter aestuarii]
MDNAAWIVPLFAGGIIAINLAVAWLTWRRVRYCVGANDIRVEKGLISRSARAVPYERIQDVSLEQKPIPRLLGLVEVRFETGAGGKDELQLAYVSKDEGERLRDVVRDLRDGVADGVAAGVADGGQDIATGAAGEAGPSGQSERSKQLFAMGPRRLLLLGLFEFSLIAIAVLGGAAQQLDFLLPFNLWDVGEWQHLVSGPGAWLMRLGWAAQIVGMAIAIAVLGVVGLGTGVLRTFLRDWDFRLDQTPKGFRRRRGLLTKTDVVMPAHRVQAITVGTGLLRRVWGWHSLSFVSLAQDAKSANHVVAPLAQLEEIAPIAEAAHFTLPAADADWHRPSRKYRLDKALMGAIPAALAGSAALVFIPSVLPGLALFGLAGFIIAQQHFLWLHERHALDARQIISRRGWLVPRLQIANRVKLHSVEIAQGPISRRRGYADLKFGLAGGSFAFHGLSIAEAQAMRAAVLDSIASVDFSRLPR